MKTYAITQLHSVLLQNQIIFKKQWQRLHFTQIYNFIRFYEDYRGIQEQFFSEHFRTPRVHFVQVVVEDEISQTCYGKDITLAKNVAMNPATTKMESFAKIVDGF